jgi:phosphomannomutase
MITSAVFHYGRATREADMNVDPSIFKTYDIRGTCPDQLTPNIAYALGRAYATHLIRKRSGNTLRVVVGGDMRHSTPELKEAYIRALIESGISVDDAGTVSTPTLYFACGYFGYDGGVQVSASHNPKDWNGFKMTEKFGRPISKHSGIAEMHALVETDAFAPLMGVAHHGKYGTRTGIMDALITDHIAFANPDKTRMPLMKIAIDTGNGMGSSDMEALFANVPANIVWLNNTLDGSFPAHEADPMVAHNNIQLQETIREEQCDLGIASDGDGDRYFFFDETGAVIPQEILRGLMAEMILRENPGATIVYDVRPGRITRELIENAGGIPKMAPVGHSLIKESMLESDAPFGGESSGHFFFRLPYGTFEAPVVLVLLFLRWIAEHPGRVSDAITAYRRYVNSGEINTKLPDRETGLRVLEVLKKKFDDAEHHTLDGLTVEYPDFWFNVRLSNTGGATLRCILEARDEETMVRKRDEILAYIVSEVESF